MMKLYYSFTHLLKFSILDLLNSKLRTFLSSFGISIGFFIIVGILSIIESLQFQIESELNSLGKNTVFIQKQPWVNSDDFPWWKYLNRPDFKMDLVRKINIYSLTIEQCSFVFTKPVTYSNNSIQLNNNYCYCVSEDFFKIQNVEICFGRNISNEEFYSGAPVIILGHEIAKILFDKIENSINKTIRIGNNKVKVIGVIKKEGINLLGRWDFDNIAFCSYNYSIRDMRDFLKDGYIIAKGKKGYSIEDINNDLIPILRKLRKVKPPEPNNFNINDVTQLIKPVEQLFSKIKLAGLAVGGISIFVGIFGIINIMYVVVSEKTQEIGIKKALGANKGTIIYEFLIKSILITILGFIIGLLLLYLFSKLANNFLPFYFFISGYTLFFSFISTFIIGVFSGIFPAIKASKLNPISSINHLT